VRGAASSVGLEPKLPLRVVAESEALEGVYKVALEATEAVEALCGSATGFWDGAGDELSP
jgi:hypothetical protein